MEKKEQASVERNTIRAAPAYRGVTMVEVDIAYPQVAVDSIPAAGVYITGWYQECARRAYDYACRALFRDASARYRESIRFGYPFHASTLTEVFSVSYNANGFLSLFTDRYEFTGGAHGVTVRRAENWNLAGCCRMELREFFRGTGWREIFLTGIYAQINAQIAQGGDIYFDNYQQLVRRCFDPCRCYLMPTGFAVWFPQATIAPYAAGLVVFVIPFADFGDRLRFSL